MQAQQENYAIFSLKHPTKLRGEKIFYKPMVNKGDKTSIQVDSILHDRFVKLTTYYFPSYEKSTNVNAWSRKPLYTAVASEAEADMVLSGHFVIKAKSEISEQKFFETSSALGSPLPYYEVRPRNELSAEVVITYTYADKSMDTDTIVVFLESERKPKAKFHSLNELSAECDRKIKAEAYPLFHFIEQDKFFFKMFKLKVKDKDLKLENDRLVDLFKEGKVEEMGKIYKRIYAADPTPECANNIAMCYEILGNYPQAEEYYKQMPDFHTKMRMKPTMELYNYMLEIGLKPVLTEF
jgi:tetratricopeptide (TPR) repeat protein